MDRKISDSISGPEKRIYMIQDYITVNLDQELSLEFLAEKASLSAWHFHRMFKKITGEPLYAHIKRLRMEKACSMLISNPDMKVINIALCCGFETPSSFAKAFKKYLGISPSLYREQNSKNGIPKGKPGKDITSPDKYSDDALIKLYKRRKKMEIKVRELPKYRIAYMRRIGAYGPGNYEVMQKLKRWAVTRDLVTQNSLILGIAHDNPEVTPPENCRYDVGIVIPEDYDLESGINESQLPGGRYALFSVEHTPYAIAQAWNDIFSQWLPESGYQLDERPVFEMYAGTTEDFNAEPEICRICIPVRKL